jgi:photosystem II stability/assembly factor-like uncharacterized protein
MQQLLLALCLVLGCISYPLTTQAQLRDVYAPPVGFCFYGLHTFDSLRAVVCGDRGKIVITNSFFKTWSIVETGTNATLRSVDFFTPTTGIICGDSGLILRTTNGGMSWTRHTSGVSNRLNSLVCLSASVAVCVGNEGVVLRTTNTGETWNPITSPTQTGLTACAFSSDGVGIAVGFFGTILRTTDIGQTWQVLPSVTKQSLFSVAWAGTSTCLAGGDSAMVLRSTDEGASWNEHQYMYPRQTRFRIHRTNVISFRDSLNGMIAGQFSGDSDPSTPSEQRLYRTTNGGKTWLYNDPREVIEPNRDTIFSDPERYDYHAMKFISPERGIMVGTISGLVAGIGTTTDGGKTWRMVQDVNPNMDVTVNTDHPGFSDVQFPQIRGLAFKNEQEGCLLSSRGIAWTTNDGGRSLQNKRTLTRQYLNFTEPNQSTLAFTADTGLVGVSTDYGTTWNLRNITSLGTAKRCIGTFVRVLSPTKLFGYFFGIQANNIADRTYLIESTDAGDTWKRSVNVPSDWLDTTKNLIINDFIASTQTQYWGTHTERIAQNTWQSTLWSSADAGATWQKADLTSQLLPNDELLSITFTSPKLGIIAGRNVSSATDTSIRGMFYLKTTDGGISWVRYSFRRNTGWHDFTKITRDRSSFYGKENTILTILNSGSSVMYSVSTDTGNTWKELKYVWEDTLARFTSINIPQNVWFFNPNHALIGLDNMGLVEWRGDKITKVAQETDNQGESHENRISISPFPVSRTMTISVQNLGTTTLNASLLDLHGRVCIPPLQPSAVGNSEDVSFSLDCSNLSSGMYILSISDGTRSYLRTVVVTK